MGFGILLAWNQALSLSLSLCLSACLCLSVSLPLCLSASLSLCLSVSLPLCLSASLSLSVSVCLSLCLSLSLCYLVQPCAISYGFACIESTQLSTSTSCFSNGMSCLLLAFSRDGLSIAQYDNEKVTHICGSLLGVHTQINNIVESTVKFEHPKFKISKPSLPSIM